MGFPADVLGGSAGVQNKHATHITAYVVDLLFWVMMQLSMLILRRVDNWSCMHVRMKS